MKKWILIVLFILVAALGICITGWVGESKTVRAQSKHITEQSMVIDSLLNIPPAIAVTAGMTVTDKSKIDVNAKNNSGTVNVPTERVYVLELQLDSTKMTVERK